MSIEIDVLNGDASWPLVEPLFKAVWPPDVVAKLPWGRFAFAYPEWRGVGLAHPARTARPHRIPPRPGSNNSSTMAGRGRRRGLCTRARQSRRYRRLAPA